MNAKPVFVMMAGLGLTVVLTAHEPRTGEDGMYVHRGMHQRGDFPKRAMHGTKRKHSAHRNHRGLRRMGFMQTIGKYLDLTPQQRTELQMIFRQKHKASRIRKKTRRKHGKQQWKMFARLDPETFMSADHFDTDAYLKALRERADRRKAQRQARRQNRWKQRAAFLEKIFHILTPEQRVKWIEWSKEK